MSTNEVIQIACWRIDSWEQMSSADLAAAVIAPYQMQRMELAVFFALLIENGAARSELASLYNHKRFVDDLEWQLRHPDGSIGTGNYAAIMMLVGLAEDLVQMSQATVDAIMAVVAGSTKRLVDVVAEEIGESPPAEVSEADIEAALGRG